MTLALPQQRGVFNDTPSDSNKYLVYGVLEEDVRPEGGVVRRLFLVFVNCTFNPTRFCSLDFYYNKNFNTSYCLAYFFMVYTIRHTHVVPE